MFLALDLGTTTLVGRLLSVDGHLLAEARHSNPQRIHGADILARLQHANAGGGAELQQLLAEGLHTLVAELLTQASCPVTAITAAAAAGNPGICHLLLGLPVKTLIHPPHRTPLTTLKKLPPEVLNLDLNLHIFPAVSGFVGGDLVAVLFGGQGAGDWGLADNNQQPATSNQQRITSPQPPALSPCLVLDLGTNAELALWTGSQWLVTSAAAGPTFEAGNITCGMPLAPGAVTAVRHRDDRLELSVVGGGRPTGLCGSGLLALVAAARQGGLIDADGRIATPDEVGTNLARYLVANGEGMAICFHRDARGELWLTQDDVRQFQLAKGAVRAGIEVLLERTGLAAGEVAAVLITGAFGSSLPREVLRGVAMLPEAMIDKSFFVANGVLDGLGAFLRESRGPERLTALLGTIKAFPLSGTPVFEKRFLAALGFS